MKSTCIFIFLFLISTLKLHSQNQYTLNLEAEKWKFIPDLYYFSGVVDDREKKDNAGQILEDGKPRTLVFTKSLESDLTDFLNSSLKQDTLKTPLIISFDHLVFKETGSITSHKIIFDYSIKIYRVLNEKRFKLYEANGKPELLIKGGFLSYAYAKLVSNAIRTTLDGFNDWVNKNPDLPPLARSTKVFLKSSNDDGSFQKNDTLIWNENKKLGWSDFKGAPRSNSFMAESNCVFSYHVDPLVKSGILELHVQLNACFDRNNSWVKTDQKKDSLLAHEQLHFDICELNIRLLRKKLIDYSFNPLEFDNEIKILFDQAWNEYMAEQQRYDTETGHGIITEKQISWQQNIQEKLKTTPALNNFPD